jgi:DNA repair exonuclease SbcCD ATPase subunit
MYYEKYLKLQKARNEKKKELDEKLQALQKNFDKQTLEQKKEFERLKNEQDKLMKENIKDYQARCNQIKENATNAIASQQQKIKELENKLNQNHQQLLQAQQRAQQPIYVEKVTSYYSSYQPQQPLVYDRNKYYGGIPLKLDGTPDMRYKVNKQLFGRRG